MLTRFDREMAEGNVAAAPITVMKSSQMVRGNGRGHASPESSEGRDLDDEGRHEISESSTGRKSLRCTHHELDRLGGVVRCESESLAYLLQPEPVRDEGMHIHPAA
jgi:hypothetical protein